VLNLEERYQERAEAEAVREGLDGDGLEAVGRFGFVVFLSVLDHGQGQGPAHDGWVPEPAEQDGGRADVVQVPVRENHGAHVSLFSFQAGDVGDDVINAVLVLFRKF